MCRIGEEDLEHIYMHTHPLWAGLTNKTIFLTGGTGFFGKWLTESFVYINERLKLNARLIILSRNPEVYLNKYPFYRNLSHIEFTKGDITSFEFPNSDVDYIIHAATDASAVLMQEQPLLMYDTIVEGTRRVLELARIKKVKAFLHTSSGAVYGKQPSHISHIHEEFSGTPDLFHFGASYAEGKRVAEMLSYFYYSQFAVPSKIARCFAFVGPHLPLDAHFAAGNFINNLLQEKNIEIKGDGTQFRSYLYASDLAIWLWTILFKGTCCTPYNVGSDEDLTIKELAGHIASFSNKVSVFVHQKEKLNNTERYVPAIERAKNELHLEVKINLKQALAKTIEFYKQENEKS